MRQFKYTDDVGLSPALDFFKSLGTTFRLETTGSSVALVNHRFCWILASERFMPWHLGMLSKVKAEVKSNLGKVAGMAESDSESFAVNLCQFPGPRGAISVEELDLVGAYLHAALVIGLISPETVVRLQRLPKRWRLRILGAIAVRRRVDHYDAAGRVESTETIMDPELRHAWFCIVGHVDRFNRILREAVGANFVFSWYDNFFCRVGALSPRTRAAIGAPFRISKCRLDWQRVNSLLLATVNNQRRFFLPVPDLTRQADRG